MNVYLQNLSLYNDVTWHRKPESGPEFFQQMAIDKKNLAAKQSKINADHAAEQKRINKQAVADQAMLNKAVQKKQAQIDKEVKAE